MGQVKKKLMEQMDDMGPIEPKHSHVIISIHVPDGVDPEDFVDGVSVTLITPTDET
jgi:hypothetical protein